MQNLVLNFGPQHPAAHGVLRLVLTLDGEVNENPLCFQEKSYCYVLDTSLIRMIFQKNLEFSSCDDIKLVTLGSL